MDLTAEFCEAFHDDLLANMDIAHFDVTPKWFDCNQQREQVSGRKKFALIGRLSPLNGGSKFGVQGDKQRMADRVFRPINDDDIVHDVFQLNAFEPDMGDKLIKIWTNQCDKLRKLERGDIFDARSFVLNEVPLEIVSSMRSLSTGVEPQCTLETGLNIYWNKYEKPKTGHPIIVTQRDRCQVKRGVYYDPSVLPLYDPRFFSFREAKLVQYDIFDEFDHLIAPWDYGGELRANSIMAFIATFCPVNVRLHPGTFNRSFKKIYEIRGLSGRVLRRGDGAPNDQVAPLLPESYKKELLKKNKTITDFPGFRRMN